MEKQATLNRIQTEVDALIQAVENISEEHFFQQPHPEKWSVGQNILHLIKSSKPLVSLYGNPELMNQWAKSNRASKDYEATKAMYINALQIPSPILQGYRHLGTEGSKAEMLAVFKSVTTQLIERATLLSQADLDTYQIPHPLLGLLTAYEFLHFTAYHTRHHHDIIERVMVGFSRMKIQ